MFTTKTNAQAAPSGRWRVGGYGVLLCLGLGLASGTQGAAMPKELAPVAIGVMQRDAGPAYQVQEERAENAAQGWRLGFSRDGVEVRSKEGKTPWALKLGLARFGSKEALQAYPVVKREVEGNRVSYDRGAIEEWYVNGPLGLEQGFTVKQAVRPEMVLELDFDWPAQAEGRGVQLTQGDKRLYYGALHAVDAKGRVLPAVMRVVEGRVRLEVAAQGAAYPLTIDPLLTEEAKLTASDAEPGDGFSSDVALSASGKTALIGASGVGCFADLGCGGAGAAYVFVRKDNRWIEQQKLTVPDAAPFDNFGNSVALSASGKTALIGVVGDDCPAGDFCGAAYVFVHKDNRWVEQQKLTVPDAAPFDNFGNSVALSASGKTALIGVVGDDCSSADDFCGAVYVFVHKDNRWVEQQKLTASDALPFGDFGSSVALSASGKTALISGGQGTVYVFVQSQNRLVEHQKLTITQGGVLGFGSSIALSASGKTALIGAGADCTSDFGVCGATYVFRP